MARRRHISRRRFLKTAGGVIAAGALGNILSSCAPGATPTPEVMKETVEVPVKETVVVEATPTPAPAFILSPPVSSEGPDLEFRSWAWGVEVVQENVGIFQEDYDEHVHYSVISGDYSAVVATQLMTAVPLDLVYGAVQLVYKFAKAGWLHDFERHWLIDEFKGAMYDNIRESMTVDGKLYGLPYFTNAQGCVLSNELVLEKAGMKGEHPGTWDELYEQCRKIKQKGAADYPFLPKWLPTDGGIHSMLEAETLNRGVPMWDENQHPVFDGNSDLVGVLENWHSLYVDKIIPEANLTMQDSDMIDAFGRGGYAFTVWQLYECKTWNDPTVSNIAGYCRVVPDKGQPWGKLEVGMYHVPNTNWKAIPDADKDHHLARQYRLADFFGYKDKRGEFFVSKKFAIDFALGSGFPAVWDDPEVQAAFEAWVPDEQVIEDFKGVLATTSYPAAERTAWYADWTYAVRSFLAQAVTGDLSAKDAVVKCREEADKLIEMYGA